MRWRLWLVSVYRVILSFPSSKHWLEALFLITHHLRYAWTIIKMMVASKYQHIPLVTNKLVFRGNAMVGVLIFLITLDVAMAGNLKIRDGAI